MKKKPSLDELYSLFTVYEGKIKALDEKNQALDEKVKVLEDVIKKESEKPQMIPDYINKLISNGYIETDGKTAIAPLDDTAEFLYSLNMDSFNYRTLLQFRQHDGRPFAENSAKEAVKRANRTK